MGKRRRNGGGGRSPPALLEAELRRHIAAAGLDGPGAEASAVADALRSRLPRFRRQKLGPFTCAVHSALSSLPPAAARPFAAASGDSSASSGGDPSERRIRPDESANRCCRRRLRSPEPSGTNSSYSTEVADEEEPPAFDLTRSMLRSQYSNKTLAPPRSDKNAPNDMEIDVATEKTRRLITSDGGGAGDGKPTAADERGAAACCGGEGPLFRHLGGMQGVIEELMMEVIVPLCHPELPRRLGVKPIAGLLLVGPPGCGKTSLAHAIANETGVPFYKISAPEVVSGVSGASEENIRTLFQKAYRTAPSIIFIDEIDAIASKRENLHREMERRIVTQLMTCMDEKKIGSDLKSSEKKSRYILVIGATNRPDAVDQALRRPGRFDREISLGVPDENARKEILRLLSRDLLLEGQFDLFKIARATPGFVGADLEALANKAGNLAMKRIIDRRRAQNSHEHDGNNKQDWWRQPWTAEEMESLSITVDDFEEAAKLVQPSLRREGFSSIPNVTWEDVGGLDSLREKFDDNIVQRIKDPEGCEEFGVILDAGFLLFGPPGCGKTLIAKAVANEAGANFIHIKGPELLNKYVGESEAEVRRIFIRARTNAPCILFFDEVDALTTKKGREGGWVVERLLDQLVVELDGADQRQGVYAIGATNRVDMMDDALLRPGRFGTKLYVPLPGADERGSILKAHARKYPISSDVDFDVLARRKECNNLTGADLASLINEAAMAAWKERRRTRSISSSRLIESSHFEQALSKIKPSVSEKQRHWYEELSKLYS